MTQPLRWGVVALDVDGTLLPGTTVNRLVAEKFGFLSSLSDLEAKYEAGRLSNREVGRTLAAEFRGMPASVLVEAVAGAPLMDDAHRTISELRRLGVAVILASVTWHIAIVELARQLRTAHVPGLELEIASGLLTGRISSRFEAVDKARAVDLYCRQVGVALSQCVAVGDGRSDIPLFRAAGFSVAVNARNGVETCADASVRTESLAEALSGVPGLLPGGGRPFRSTQSTECESELR